MINILEVQKELQPLQSEVISFEEKVNSIVITTDEEYGQAGDLAKVIKDKGASIEKMRVFFTAPLNKQVKDINAMFNPDIEKAEAIVKAIKGKMNIYFTVKEEARLKEEKRLQDIRDRANEKREDFI